MERDKTLRQGDGAPATQPFELATSSGDFRPGTAAVPGRGDVPGSGIPMDLSQGQEPPESASNTPSEGEAVASLGEDLKNAAQTAMRAVTDQASQLATDIGDELGKTAEVQKSRGVEAFQNLARAITSAAGELEHQSPFVASSVRDAAAKIESFSRTLENRSVEDLMKAATDLARSQPMLFVGGAVAAGLALGRFLKSSVTESRRSAEQRTTVHLKQ